MCDHDYITEAEAISDYDNCLTEADEARARRTYLSDSARKARYTRHHRGPGKKLTDSELQKRVGDPRWCQHCLKRHVNKGYKICFFCS